MNINWLAMAYQGSQSLEFFEIDRCNFEKRPEINYLFHKILRDSCFKANLRYLTIQRCKLDPEFLNPYLATFLSFNESLRRLSFIQNSFHKRSPAKKQSDAKIILRASFAPGAPSEEEYSEHGLKDDMDIYEVLDCATLHPNLEIIQICQTMCDYYTQHQHFKYRNDRKLAQKDKDRRTKWKQEFAQTAAARSDLY